MSLYVFGANMEDWIIYNLECIHIITQDLCWFVIWNPNSLDKVLSQMASFAPSTNMWYSIFVEERTIL
jgi:hypothetical protein